MDRTLRIPDDLARRLGTPGEWPRRTLEAFALDACRAGHPLRLELRR